MLVLDAPNSRAISNRVVGRFWQWYIVQLIGQVNSRQDRLGSYYPSSFAFCSRFGGGKRLSSFFPLFSLGQTGKREPSVSLWKTQPWYCASGWPKYKQIRQTAFRETAGDQWPLFFIWRCRLLQAGLKEGSWRHCLARTGYGSWWTPYSTTQHP